MKIKKIKMNELKLWDENPRFPQEYFRKTEKELVEYLFRKEYNRMMDLSRSIIENFNLIPLERLVAWKSEFGLIVLEGNRRLAVYKLLNNPNIISDKKVSTFFKENSKRVKVQNNFEVECILVDDKKFGLKYVEIKHLEKGYSNWQESERINFQKRKGMSLGESNIVKHELTTIVKNLDLPKELTDSILGKGNLTTFYRVMAGTPAKKYFNYEISDNKLKIGDKNFNSKLKVIIWHLVKGKDFKGNILNTRTLNTNEQIEKYLDGLKFDKEIKKTGEEIKNSYREKIDVFGKKIKEFNLPTETNKLRKTPILKVNDKLFGKTLCLKKGKVNNLYNAIDRIYNQNKHNDQNLEAILPILGMSLRLILDVAAREYYRSNGSSSNEDALYKKFIGEIKKEYKSLGRSEDLNFISLNDIFTINFEAYLGKYAHGNIIYDKPTILKVSKIIGEILEKYFGNRK